MTLSTRYHSAVLLGYLFFSALCSTVAFACSY